MLTISKRTVLNYVKFKARYCKLPQTQGKVLQSALKLIINQNFLIDHYKKEVINIKLQNVQAYKDNTNLKNKLKNNLRK